MIYGNDVGAHSSAPLRVARAKTGSCPYISPSIRLMTSPVGNLG